MQNRRLPNFLKRAQYYAANTYSGQLSNGEDYLSLRPVVLLAILDHTFFEKKPHYISYHKILDEHSHDHDLQDMSYAFVELSKFSKSEEDLETVQDHWLYMLKNVSKLKKMPKEVSFPEITVAYKTLEEHSWTPLEREDYDRTPMAIMDEIDANRGATEQGIAQGIAQGIVREKERMIMELLRRNLNDQVILVVGEITPQQLEEFKAKFKKSSSL